MNNSFREQQLELEKSKLQEELASKKRADEVQELKKKLEYLEEIITQLKSREPTVINNTEGETILGLNFNLKTDTLSLTTNKKELSAPIPVRVNEYTKVVESKESIKNENATIENKFTANVTKEESPAADVVIDNQTKKYYADVSIVINPKKGKLGNYATIGWLFSPSSARDPDATVEVYDKIEGRRLLIGNAYPFTSAEHSVVIRSECGKKIIGYAKNNPF
ncbi:MAG: hypothetical protein [Caudoviricetes sp.]|nr:MAG: hypothetical protein [Caudoviricetes sp.]